MGGRRPGGGRGVSSVSWVADCPAKINLTLRVVARRPDGYHELDTVFQAIDLWDRLELVPRDDDRLTLACDDARVPTDDRNLVLRAADGFRRAWAPRGRGADFRLHKAIPMQGGLGGGSSDAAGALLLCGRHWGVEPGRPALERLASGLGADVPFFLTGGTARGTGRGDRIEALRFAGEVGLLLGLPPHGIPTREVFEDLGARLTLPPIGVSVRSLSEHKWPGDNDFSVVANDLEAVVFDRWPDLRRFRDALITEGAQGAALSGSGSTVYGVFPDAERRRGAEVALGARFPTWKLLATRTVSGGPRIVPRDTRRGPA